MLALADAHCHLDPHHFSEGPDPVLARAAEAGVVGFVVVGLARPPEEGGSGGTVDEALEPVRFVLDLVRRLPGRATACVGLHPHDARAWSPPLHDALARLAQDPCVAAVGEIGLDYHYMRSPEELQKAVFRRFIALARAVKKPIVVHTREAPADTLAILEEEGARDVGGIIHCFSEDRPFAEKALALGFDLSFSGIVTFKTAQAVKDVAAWAPGDRILVETDSPYLAPVPFRGKKCEPAHVVYTARHVAALRGEDVADLAARTTANAVRRLGLAE